MLPCIKDYVHQVADFRQIKKCKHRLSDILLIGICTYLSNGQDYEDMTLFAQSHATSLPELFDLSNGIPSHDTFRRVFQLLDCQELRKILTAQGKAILETLAEKQICFDGKKLRGANPTSRGNEGLWIVNAWVGENRLCVCQEKVDDKSNEINAIPLLLKQLDITDAVVTIDAMGCQTAIAQQIQDQQGHYLLAVKGNQGELLDEITCAFKACPALSSVENWEYDRNRFETRHCSILAAPPSLDSRFLAQWPGLSTLVKVVSTRLLGEKKREEIRYYISDELVTNALYFSYLARGHWGIENQLHWHLDVTFGEDACRVRTGNGPENLATLRKFALHLITHRKDRLSLKKRRVKAAYDIEYLKELLT
jgi:predicted transposase YbfD/YdcC